MPAAPEPRDNNADEDATTPTPTPAPASGDSLDYSVYAMIGKISRKAGETGLLFALFPLVLNDSTLAEDGPNGALSARYRAPVVSFDRFGPA